MGCGGCVEGVWKGRTGHRHTRRLPGTGHCTARGRCPPWCGTTPLRPSGRPGRSGPCECLGVQGWEGHGWGWRARVPHALGRVGTINTCRREPPLLCHAPPRAYMGAGNPVARTWARADPSRVHGRGRTRHARNSVPAASFPLSASSRCPIPCSDGTKGSEGRTKRRGGRASAGPRSVAFGTGRAARRP